MTEKTDTIQKTSIKVTDVLLHRPPMLLIDEIESITENNVQAWTKIDPKAWYALPDGSMPSWIGLELMAQAAACYIGNKHKNQGHKQQIGYLLGTRSYKPIIKQFSPTAPLFISCDVEYLEDTGLGAFDCRIEQNGHILVQATLKIFEPVQQR